MTVLLVALMIALFLGVDWLLQRREALRAPAPALAAGPRNETVRLPQGVFFARSHTWLNLFPTGRVWLGVDDFVVRLLERPKVRFLHTAGSRVKRGEPLFVLQDGDRTLTLRSPLEARIVAWNHELAERPELLRRAPFCEGWACDLKPDRPDEMKALLLGEETRGWMQEEFRRLRDVFAGVGGELSPAMLQDGGPPIAGALKHVDAAVWDRFDREFLEVR